MTFGTETDAARDLKLPVKTFRELVQRGVLPGPVLLLQDAAGVERYDLDEIRRIVRGKKPEEEIQW